MTGNTGTVLVTSMEHDWNVYQNGNRIMRVHLFDENGSSTTNLVRTGNRTLNLTFPDGITKVIISIVSDNTLYITQEGTTTLTNYGVYQYSTNYTLTKQH